MALEECDCCLACPICDCHGDEFKDDNPSFVLDWWDRVEPLEDECETD